MWFYWCILTLWMDYRRSGILRTKRPTSLVRILSLGMSGLSRRPRRGGKTLLSTRVSSPCSYHRIRITSLRRWVGLWLTLPGFRPSSALLIACPSSTLIRSV